MTRIYVILTIFAISMTCLVTALPASGRVHGPQSNGLFNNQNANGFRVPPNVLTDNDFRPVDGFVFDGPADRPINRPLFQNTQNPPARPRMTTVPTTSSSTTSASQGSNTGGACQDNCPTTPEYNPICGTDGVVYSNPGKLSCARRCGKSVELSHYGPCPSTTTASG
ncbi:uncharacterized protein LOC107272044 isoform X1 [Cephus cinctus]|uniref:Uncharacterized protein LOC107272044 isoform X1 n=1 Tax=Cephus cinctus TaxID=211228 RepID=A0AAJ7C851_CEPCN|nr:uncharacterized protein LOC107272044 isoform X1 [Cephus cinctus]